MEIKIDRIERKDDYTIGKLYINNQYICDTLEDRDRGLSDLMSLDKIKKDKVYGETAIPYGKYNVSMDIVSPKFKDRKWAIPYDGKIPRILNVKGFTGILIHVGNTNRDTKGCILVGTNTNNGFLIHSTEAFNKLMKILRDTSENITINIV